MKIKINLFSRVDWLLFTLYASLVFFGWLNIYAVSYGAMPHQSGLSLFSIAGKQLLWITLVLCLFVVTLLLETRLYQSFAYIFYVFTMLLLLVTVCWGVSKGGHKAWLWWGGQPAELAKLACALAIAKYLDGTSVNVRLTERSMQWVLLGLIALPIVLILWQGDVGSSLVFTAFFLVLYREGFPLWCFLVGCFVCAIVVAVLFIPPHYLLIGTLGFALLLIGLVRKKRKHVIRILMVTAGTSGLIQGAHWLVQYVLKPHQQNRLKTLVDPHMDPLGIGWNVTQSKIAIGSGGLWGKGFLQGSQTKYGFVPEQSTDFIFCTIGEEYGWLGTAAVIGAFLGLLLRICYIAERQKTRFARAYGYAVAAVLFAHFMINIGMTIGLMPVIGIPLPFISYGGSSLCVFSLMLFVLFRLDAEKDRYGSYQQGFS